MAGHLTEFLYAVGKALGLIMVGFLARRTEYVSPAAGAGLSEFVGKIAVPVALFRGISTLPLFLPESATGGSGTAVDWPVLMCGFLGKFVLFWVAALLGVILRKSTATCAVYGLVCSLSNDAALGLPILNTTHPKVGVSLIFLMTLPCCTLLLPLGLALCEMSKKRSKDDKTGSVGILLLTFSRVLQQPLIASVAVALTYNYITGGMPLPRVVDQIMEPIGLTLSVAALFSLGASLCGTSISLRSLATPVLLVALKIFGNGFVCRCTASELFGIGEGSSSAEMLALYSALPAAPLVWALARDQNADADTIGSAVVLGTLFCGPAMVLENAAFRAEALQLSSSLWVAAKQWASPDHTEL